MLPESRRKMVLEQVAKQGFATLGDLVSTLGVSESTIRRDLEVLDESGLVKRIHGGAVSAGELRSLPGLDERSATSASKKRPLARPRRPL